MRELTEANLRVAFDKMSNHNLYIAAEDIIDLLGADASEEDVKKMLEENNLKTSSQIYFSEVQYSTPHCSLHYIHESQNLRSSSR
jgi:Ca2+-binding EF-hand superfamily protein